MRYGAVATNPPEWFALQMGMVPLPILDTLLGPIQGRALIAAERLGLFEALSAGPATAEALAKTRGLDRECTTLVLRLIRAMGYVDLADGRFALSKLGEAHFGRAARESYRAFVEYGLPQWEMVSRIEEVVKTGAGIDFHEHHDAGEWDAYQRAMVENARGFGWFVAKHMPVPAGATSCIDIAGAHGLIGAMLCRKHPGLRSTVLDRAEALPRARQIAESLGHADVVTFREGDLRRDELGSGLDVALLCNILHHFTPAENVEILRRTKKALKPGGSVGIFDIETPADDAAPDAAGDAFALYFRITSTSSCFRGDDYVGWLREAGFSQTRVVRSVKMPSRMLVIGTT
ncbi:MAG: methyltransferase [Sandaracinaceae bacterium]|nr:methyltransferase [Sandaracinaceae bacterium]